MSSGDNPAERLEKEKERIQRANLSDDAKRAITETIERADLSDNTRVNYGRNLRRFGEWLSCDITELSADEINSQLHEMADDHEWTSGTLSGYQSAAKLFADHTGLNDELINVISSSAESSVDPRDILTDDEFHQLREAAPSMRDRCLIDLLGYTGQRLRVIQTLKIEDVDPGEGVYYMPEADGLKGADKTGQKRPLLAARQSVQEWVQMHPTGEPNDYLITPLPHAPHSEPGDQMAQRSIQRRLKNIGERAGIDKPVNPHAFRHRFVTICKKQYDMDDGTVKHLIGHGKGSRVMETTYRHLSDDDHISEAEAAMGLDDEDDDATLSPPVCPTCSRPLRPSAETCPACGERFTPGTDDAAPADAGPRTAADGQQFAAEAVEEVLNALGPAIEQRAVEAGADPDEFPDLSGSIEDIAEGLTGDE